jgi:pimeloyl-ACP methyl ester carboxylesterase
MRIVENRVVANGLEHHVITWSPEGPQPEATVLCAHGFLDVGWSFRQVAERLVARGHRVVAFDWRGHGESAWIPAGGYYHFLDYVADLADLVDALAPGPLHLVGHSMGGVAASFYAGAFPARVERFVNMEGLGPPAVSEMEPPARTASWVESARRARRQQPRVMATLDEALARMRIQTPELPDDLGRELAARSTRAVEGGRVWSFDPLHRTRGPYAFRADVFEAHLRAITAPTLYIEGERGYRVADQAERRAALRNARDLAIPGVGHMMHWLAPAAVAEAIDAFLR